MNAKKNSVIKTVLLTLVFSSFTLSISKDYKAETTGVIKKTILLKTTELKVDKKIISEGPKKEEESSGYTNVSRGTSSANYDIVNLAYEQLGAPYVWGATGPYAFDCSGLTSYVYSAYGIELPRTASDQFYAGTQVSMEELQPGDLVFFNTYANLGHVGIYIGGGDFIHAGTDSVVISSIYGSYYSETYAGAVRVL